MRSIKALFAGLSLTLLLTGPAPAGGDLNEVGALLVYPAIATFESHDEEGYEGQRGVFSETETFVTITNAGNLPVVAHVAYINGDAGSSQYCYECNFELPLSGNDTETLVVTSSGGGIAVESEDSPLSVSCPFAYGMMVVSLEDGFGNTLTDNVLLGEEVVVDYAAGSAFSVPAIPFQGGDGGNGDRTYAFDDNEYGKMPRIVAADFLAPRVNDPSSTAELVLFTLNFDRQFPPLTDCSVTGFDANEHPFSSSFLFGCWGAVDLCEISPEFCHPNLGLYSGLLADTHGWVQLNCRVDRNPAAADGFEANGGVHGAIVQTQDFLSTLPAGSGATFQGAAAWARLLYQSVTTGDAVTLHLEAPGQGLD
jgi:hypothetical protein